jgi:glycopeptide antibiotics resistance protein
LTGFLFSLAVEIVQMFSGGHSDINDLMTNTAGACIGFLSHKKYSTKTGTINTYPLIERMRISEIGIIIISLSNSNLLPIPALSIFS